MAGSEDAPRADGDRTGSSPTSTAEKVQRGALALLLLYLFLVGVGLLEDGIAQMGEGVQEAVLAGVQNPVAGLFAGILATIVVQSSSVSTSTIVGLVAAGVVPVEVAVPMIMGANIGTTVTNTLVSLMSLQRRAEFERVFAAATMHDLFNFLAVAILLPLELVTGFLSTGARWLGEQLAGLGIGGAEFDSPIELATAPVNEALESGSRPSSPRARSSGR